MRNTGRFDVARPSLATPVKCLVRVVLGGVLLGSGACSSEEPVSPVGVVLVAEASSDTWTRSPVPKRLVIDGFINGATSSTRLVSTSWPVETFSLGTLDESASIQLVASLDDGASSTEIRCAPASFSVADFSGSEVSMFCGRTGEFSTTAPTWAAPFVAPTAWGVALDDRYVIFGTSDSTGSFVFDRLLLSAYAGTVSLPLAASTVASLDGRSLLMISHDQAQAFDTQTGDVFDIALHGLDAASLAGGATLLADDGTLYVVGATRPISAGDPTDAILVIDPSGAISSAHLREPRRGATAAWVSNVGLVVVGGDQPAHAEILEAAATSTTLLAGPLLRAVSGAAALVVQSTIVLVGGHDDAGATPSLGLDLTCATNCDLNELGTAISMTPAALIPQPDGSWLVVGEDATSQDVASILTFDGTTVNEEIIVSLAKHGARSKGVTVALDDGWALHAGGAGDASKSIQLFAPR